MTGATSGLSPADRMAAPNPRRPLAVVAVGGNALIPDAKRPGIRDQYEAAAASSAGIIDLIEGGWDVVLTHGNGPQVGFALRRSELVDEVPALPMDYADADTQGVIGYMFQRAIGNELRKRGIRRDTVTLVTQVVVDPDDPAMDAPTKPIGAFMSEPDARKIEAEGWHIAEDAHRGWRRVVPSPAPREIVELPAIRSLACSGFIVVACGGGGIPVTRVGNDLCGVRAVIDKDLTASLLARRLDAELLLISTAVERIAIDFGTPRQRWLDTITADDLARYHREGQFAPGSMEPKARAILEYLRAGGTRAIVTDPAHIAEAVRGAAGTIVEA